MRSIKLNLNVLADAVNLKPTIMNDLHLDYESILTRSLAQGGTVTETKFMGGNPNAPGAIEAGTADLGDSTPVSRETRNDRPDVSTPHGNGGFASKVRWSPTRSKLITALAKAQKDFKPLKRNAENTFYSTANRKATYADLEEVIEATRDALSKNGLVVTQDPIVDIERKAAGCVTCLCHESGEWKESELLLPITKFDPPGCGSGQTYARRYARQAIVDLAAEFDDDGNKAAGIGTKEAQAEVVTRKLKEANQAIPALFYQLEEVTGQYRITGSQSLLNATRDLLKQFWVPARGLHLVDDEQLEALKYEMDKRHIEFRVLKAK